MVKPRHVAIIPARGGSKRIPRKNVLDFFGKPMVVWTIEAARASGWFERILVSTDDPEIAAIAREAGADVPFLRTEAADDMAPISQATLHALDQLQVACGETYDVVVQLMPNCPLRGHYHIEDALEHFSHHDAEFQISSFKFGWMNPWWAVTVDGHGNPSPLFAERLSQRSQDLDDLYCPTGAIWVASVPALQRSGTFYGDRHVFYPLPWQAAVDIDDHDDLAMARGVYLSMRAACES